MADAGRCPRCGDPGPVGSECGWHELPCKRVPNPQPSPAQGEGLHMHARQMQEWLEGAPGECPVCSAEEQRDEAREQLKVAREEAALVAGFLDEAIERIQAGWHAMNVRVSAPLTDARFHLRKVLSPQPTNQPDLDLTKESSE